jgi:hypothetical protein
VTVYKRQQRREGDSAFELPLGQQTLAALDSYFQVRPVADLWWQCCLPLLLVLLALLLLLMMLLPLRRPATTRLVIKLLAECSMHFQATLQRLHCAVSAGLDFVQPHAQPSHTPCHACHLAPAAAGASAIRG